MNRERMKEREFSPSIQSKALVRYEDMVEFIKGKKTIKDEDLFAYMFEEWGVTEKTVARYLKVAATTGKLKVEMEGHQYKVIWINDKVSSL